MNIISVENLTKYHSDKDLFEDISFGIDEGQKIALIGVNGSGKSTLLKILAGKELPDKGNISFKKNIHVNFLEQTPSFNSEHTILEHIFNSDNAKVNLIKRYEICCDKITHSNNETLQNELKEIMQEMDRLDVWQYEYDIKSVLSELGINNLNIKMETLSGGMLKKVALAQSLIDISDLLIMDEPTNHLDIDTIQWLESYLQKTTKSILLVTHDRYLVDSVCNIIFELDKGKLYQFSGNFSYYLEKKAEIENSLIQEDNRIKSILRTEIEWLKRGPRARGTKSKERIQRIKDMMERKTNKNDSNIEISISGRRIGKKILELKKVSKSYNNKIVIKPFSYIFKRQERIGIVGPNGSGKTTFLNLLTEKESPDSGSIDIGINTHFGYFDQYSQELNPDIKAIDFVKESGNVIELPDGKKITASQMLERFLFSGNIQHNPISKLSGGEKRRLYLLHVLMKNPNFLIFDEPTNDFDVKTLAVLEDFLNEFGGCLIVVSHDRYFMDKVCDYLFVFDKEGNISEFPSNYSDYLNYKKELESDKAREEKSKVRKEEIKPKTKTKLSFNEKYELENIENEIEKLEKEKSELDKLFVSGETDFEKISEWNVRYKQIDDLLTNKMERWEYLASFEI